jgi:hypothetical protein
MSNCEKEDTMQVNPRVRQVLIAAGLVLFAAGSLSAQMKRYPTMLANSDREIHGTQAQTSDRDEVNYRFLTIDPEGRGHCYIDAHSLNDAGQVVVDWTDNCNAYSNMHAARWDAGLWTSLDYVDQSCPDMATYLTSYNDRGIAFGTYYSVSCNYEPAAGIDVKTDKWFVLPYVKGFPINQGFCMSNNGLAVGQASTDLTYSVNQSWIWDGSKYSFPTYPANWDVSALYAGPFMINDLGRIVGYYVDNTSGVTHGFLQEGQQLTTIDAPGDPFFTALDKITDSGNVLVLGFYSDEDSPYYPAHNWIWRAGDFTSLPNVPFAGAVWTYVWGLNERGDLSGEWLDSNGLEHAFVALRK